MQGLSNLAWPKTRFRVEKRGKFTLIGEGAIGGKAREALEKHEACERVGLPFPETLILATDFFDGLYGTAERIASDYTDGQEWALRAALQRSVARAHISSRIPERDIEEAVTGHVPKNPCVPSLPELQQALVGASFPEEELSVLETIADAGLMLAVRSSQLQETGGTGKYFSGFAEFLGGLIDRVKRVVASSAKKDMAVMIQPVVLEVGEYAPRTGGCAYTTRLSHNGEGKIVIVNGFGTKAVQRGGSTYFFGARLRKSESDPASTYINTLSPFGEMRFKPSPKKASQLADERAAVLTKLPRRLRALEREIGKPQYIEFASNGEGIYCVQIADTRPLPGASFDFNPRGKLLEQATTVNGYGQFEFVDIFYPIHGAEVGGLAKIDARFSHYLLVLNSGLFSKMGNRSIQPENIRNVGGILLTLTNMIGLQTVHFVHDETTSAWIAGNHIREALGIGFPFMVVRDAYFLLGHGGETIGDFVHVRLPVRMEVNEAIGTGQLRLEEK